MTCECGRTLTETEKVGATSYVCTACGKVTREERTSVWGQDAQKTWERGLVEGGGTRSVLVTLLGVADLVLTLFSFWWVVVALYARKDEPLSQLFGLEVRAWTVSTLFFLLLTILVLIRRARRLIMGLSFLPLVIGLIAWKIHVTDQLSFWSIGILLAIGLAHSFILWSADAAVDFSNAAEARRQRRSKKQVAL